MSRFRYNIALFIVGFFIGSLVYATQAVTQTESAPTTFDHTNCQYPDRKTNPVDGCDNSDPACGEIAKGADHCFADTNKPTPVETMPEAPVSQISNDKPVSGCAQ